MTTTEMQITAGPGKKKKKKSLAAQTRATQTFTDPLSRFYLQEDALLTTPHLRMS